MHIHARIYVSLTDSAGLRRRVQSSAVIVDKSVSKWSRLVVRDGIDSGPRTTDLSVSDGEHYVSRCTALVYTSLGYAGASQTRRKMTIFGNNNNNNKNIRIFIQL